IAPLQYIEQHAQCKHRPDKHVEVDVESDDVTDCNDTPICQDSTVSKRHHETRHGNEDCERLKQCIEPLHFHEPVEISVRHSQKAPALVFLLYIAAREPHTFDHFQYGIVHVTESFLALLMCRVDFPAQVRLDQGKQREWQQSIESQLP